MAGRAYLNMVWQKVAGTRKSNASLTGSLVSTLHGCHAVLLILCSQPKIACTAKQQPMTTTLIHWAAANCNDHDDNDSTTDDISHSNISTSKINNIV